MRKAVVALELRDRAVSGGRGRRYAAMCALIEFDDTEQMLGITRMPDHAGGGLLHCAVRHPQFTDRGTLQRLQLYPDVQRARSRGRSAMAEADLRENRLAARRRRYLDFETAP
jgi:hypothetical protein